jgi:hypothetical protein
MIMVQLELISTSDINPKQASVMRFRDDKGRASVGKNHVLGAAVGCNFAIGTCTSRLSSPTMHTFSPATADG